MIILFIPNTFLFQIMKMKKKVSNIEGGTTPLRINRKLEFVESSFA